MATTGYDSKCPRCEGLMEVTEDTKVGALIYPTVRAFCLECGFITWADERFADLDEMNERRADRDLPPLEELKKLKYGCRV